MDLPKRLVCQAIIKLRYNSEEYFLARNQSITLAKIGSLVRKWPLYYIYRPMKSDYAFFCSICLTLAIWLDTSKLTIPYGSLLYPIINLPHIDILAPYKEIIVSVMVTIKTIVCKWIFLARIILKTQNYATISIDGFQ